MRIVKARDHGTAAAVDYSRVWDDELPGLSVAARPYDAISPDG